jgi:hypothetical protein
LGAAGFVTDGRGVRRVAARRDFGVRRLAGGGISLTEPALAAGLRPALKRDPLVVVGAFGIDSFLTEGRTNCGIVASRPNSSRTLRSMVTEPDSLLPITVWPFAANGTNATLEAILCQRQKFVKSGGHIPNPNL